VNVITPVQNTNNIRYADFVQVVTPSATYQFATTPTALTIPAVSSTPFDGLGALVSIGDIQRDIKSTANQTTITLVGIDTSLLGWVLSQQVKGAQITMWKGFFDTDGNLITGGGSGGLYQYFYGYINTFSIGEQWMEEARMYVGTITVSASNIQIILQNRVGGRFTNDASWQFYNSGDTSMSRVGFVSTIYYPFGKQV
jgi:hypothetical protein